MMKFSMRGDDKVKTFLKDLPRGVKFTAMTAIAKYIIGNSSHGLKHNPARVQHGADNPYQWQSEKQRRAYFASNGFGGGIPYNRTGKLSEGWAYSSQGSNYTTVKIENKEKYADFVQGESIQRGHVADKWRKYLQVVQDNMAGALRSANAAVNAWLASKK